ncbi:MAG: cytochrome c maturation protein CcmE [bacterium]|nr:cytochrome c maturation protein CcmE [bacterium]MDE0290604.1 cytochrome c maturation protein CcmE [bacterium]MDE0439942.1 cytochrome c maturation protein CcmE [bacterium]
MIRRRVVLAALAMLAIVIGYLVWGNLADNLVYYLTPSEAVDQRSDFEEGERFRLGGLVEEGSIEETDEGVRFKLGDGATSIRIDHLDTPPQLFRAGVGVVVEGAWDGERFRSDVLLVNHDEQYRSPEGEGAYEVPASEE